MEDDSNLNDKINVHIYNTLLSEIKIKNNSFPEFKSIVEKELEINRKGFKDYSNIEIYYRNKSDRNIIVNDQKDFEKFLNNNDIKKDIYIQPKELIFEYDRPKNFNKKIELILQNESNKIINNIKTILFNQNMKEEEKLDTNGNKCYGCKHIMRGKIYKCLMNDNEFFCQNCSNFHEHPLLIIN